MNFKRLLFFLLALMLSSTPISAGEPGCDHKYVKSIVPVYSKNKEKGLAMVPRLHSLERSALRRAIKKQQENGSRVDFAPLLKDMRWRDMVNNLRLWVKFGVYFSPFVVAPLVAGHLGRRFNRYLPAYK